MASIKLSVIESVYLIFMFLFFKTSIDFNIIASPKGWLFKHLIGDKYSLRICPFGRIAIFALIFILIMRNYINIPPRFVKFALIVAAFLSLINMNALVYLLPVFLIEFVSFTIDKRFSYH